MLAAPNTADPELIAEADRRLAMVHDSRQKAAEAAKIAEICLNTAQHMEWTLDEYRRALARR